MDNEKKPPRSDPNAAAFLLMVWPSQKSRHLGLQGFQRILGFPRRLRGRGRGLFGGFGRRSGWATRRLNVRLWLLRRLG
ncbi:MAG: hypothetical protein WA733_22110, partial [Methylocystis sp.]